MEKIGKYEIIEELGKGGMGAVYKAFDPVIERHVAIKVILERILSQPEVKERFFREAKALGKLSHENITVLHDVGDLDGRPFIVLEYLEGTDLTALMRGEKPLATGEKLNYALQICHGLKAAHDSGIVHRDIKPENIRVLSNGKIKIMDFGIAKPPAGTLTRTGMVLGTPYYMSPEQIKGLKIDKRSDIFSFGVLFYEMLTNKKPFTGETADSIMYQIVHEDPEPLQLAESNLNQPLQNIVSKCLQKERDKRYGDFSSVIADIDDAVQQSQVETVTIQRPKAPPRRNYKLMVSAFLILVLCALGALWYFRPDQAESPEPKTELAISAENARAVMLQAKSDAQEAGADSLASAIYQQALQDEKEGDLKFQEAQFSDAEERYSSATSKFKRAGENAHSEAVAATSSLGQLRDQIETIKEELQREKSAALRANADTKSRSLHQQAVNSESLAEQHVKGQDRESLTAALRAYTDARDTFKSARQQAVNYDRTMTQIDAARQNMQTAKSAVPDVNSEKSADADYQQALTLERSGENQLQAGNLQASLRSFRDAADRYEKAASSITSSLKASAESAKTSMLASKREIEQDLHDHELYQKAAPIESRANDAFANKDYTFARQKYAEADKLFNDLLSVAQSKPDLNESVQGLTQKYAASIESGDMARLQNLYTRFLPPQEKKWGNLFQYTKFRQVNVGIEKIDESENKPVVYLSMRLTYVDNKNREQETTEWYAWTLEQRDGDWLIADVVER